MEQSVSALFALIQNSLILIVIGSISFIAIACSMLTFVYL